MSYQACPICKGLGSVGVGFPNGDVCRTCGGTGIINEVTGKPPDNNIVTTTTLCDEKEGGKSGK